MTALRGGRQKFPDIHGYFRKCLVPRPWPWLVVSFPLRLGTRLPHVRSPTSTLGHDISWRGSWWFPFLQKFLDWLVATAKSLVTAVAVTIMLIVTCHLKHAYLLNNLESWGRGGNQWLSIFQLLLWLEKLYRIIPTMFYLERLPPLIMCVALYCLFQYSYECRDAQK